MDDAYIVELYFARDEQAIEKTDAKYGKLCHRIAYNILNNDEDAVECVNDTYLGVWNAIPPTRPNNFSAFICKIARNISLKRLESETRQKRSAGVLVSLEELGKILPDESIADGISDGDIARLISDFLRLEKKDARNVFLRKYYFFDSVSDIEQRYGFSESKIKSMLYHTRKRLRKFLEKEGVKI